MKTPCPHPTKSRYATLEAATKAAHRVTHQVGLPLRPYECPCSWWHLTKTPAPAALPTASDATLADVQRLASLPDIDFRNIVAADARGEGKPGDRGALRAPQILTRWKRCLGQLHKDLNDQFQDNRGDKSLLAEDWRKRATSYRETLALRLSECRRLKAEAHAEMVRNKEYKKHDAEVAAAAGASVQELRAHAGEVAKERLINAHQAEFRRYLVDAYTDLGISLPARIRRRIAESAPETLNEEQAS
ncbi:hypothetical protein ACIFUY_06750 [Streptomyces sp. CACIS-1.16CA]|uniref:hypothetical protein n=1 Tax=Streptomyces sp. CACIS-1.16CA TaxID=1175510 RepID=UPI0037D3B777